MPWQFKRRRATAAERLLAKAPLWLDASKPTADGGLRNLGYGGSILNARSGSGAGVDAFDPISLQPDPSGYVHLPAAIGNNLQIAAPIARTVSATLQVAYLIDDHVIPVAGCAFGWKNQGTSPYPGILVYHSTSNAPRIYAATGAIQLDTGYMSTGPGFAAKGWRHTWDLAAGTITAEYTLNSSLSGPWIVNSTYTGASSGSFTIPANTLLKIGENSYSAANTLGGKFKRATVTIDGALVIDVDAAAITSGGQTSFVTSTGHTATLNRTTAGLKATPVLANAKSLLSTRYYEIAHHDLIDPGAASATMIGFVRQWGTPVNNGTYFQKRAGTNGWLLYNNLVADSIRGALYSTGNAIPTVSTAVAAGTTKRVAMVIDRTANTAQVWNGPNASSAVSLSTVGSLSNTDPLQIGKNGAAYQDFEFMGFAYFQRALTTTEMDLCTAHYSARYP